MSFVKVYIKAQRSLPDLYYLFAVKTHSLSPRLHIVFLCWTTVPWPICVVFKIWLKVSAFNFLISHSVL